MYFWLFIKFYNSRIFSFHFDLGAATNLFVNGTVFDLYVYLSEDEEFLNFNDSNSLVWKHEGLIYGDWYSGTEGDGIYR